VNNSAFGWCTSSPARPCRTDTRRASTADSVMNV
jgi:hypothetical protein